MSGISLNRHTATRNNLPCNLNHIIRGGGVRLLSQKIAMLVNLVEKEVFGVIRSANSDTGINVVFEKPDMGINLRHWSLVVCLSPIPHRDEVEEEVFGPVEVSATSSAGAYELESFCCGHRVHVACKVS